MCGTSLSRTYFNNSLNDGGVDHFDIPVNDDDEYQYDIPINNRESRPISPMTHSRRRITIDPLVSLSLVLPSNLVALNLVRSCNYDDICMGKLFTEKNELMLELRKVALRDKFDLKIVRSITTHFEAYCSLESCK